MKSARRSMESKSARRSLYRHDGGVAQLILNMFRSVLFKYKQYTRWFTFGNFRILSQMEKARFCPFLQRSFGVILVSSAL